MTDLLLHIGSPKAGSSSIQSSLWRRSELCSPGDGPVLLPPNPLGRPMPSGFIAACYQPVDQLPRYLAARYRRDPLQFKDEVVRYQEMLSDILAQNKSAILSSEFLFRFSEQQIKDLRAWFSGLGVRRFRVLVYIRDPVSAYGSFLQQWLRISDDLAPYNPWTWSYKIRLHLESWRSVFGPDELVVRSFDRDQLKEGSVVADFYQQCSSWFEMVINGPEEGGVNQSLGVEALMLVQDLIKSVPMSRREELSWMSNMAKINRLLRDQSVGLDCSPLRLRPAVRKLIYNQHADDLNWLAETYGIVWGSKNSLDLFDRLPVSKQVSGLGDLVKPPQNPALIDQLRHRLLEAVVREGLQ